MLDRRERLCPTCHGAGEERFRQRGLRPEFNVWGCYPCAVDGEAGYKRECRECNGAGFIGFNWLPSVRQEVEDA